MCPTSHPFAIEGGSKCCADYVKVDNPSLHIDCDGLVFKVADSELCCSRKVDCPAEEEGQRCRANQEISRGNTFTIFIHTSVIFMYEN